MIAPLELRRQGRTTRGVGDPGLSSGRRSPIDQCMGADGRLHTVEEYIELREATPVRLAAWLIRVRDSIVMG